MKICKRCGINEATLPDRNKIPGRLIREICTSCHSAELTNDLKCTLKTRYSIVDGVPTPENLD
jgi:hypothetical protein